MKLTCPPYENESYNNLGQKGTREQNKIEVNREIIINDHSQRVGEQSWFIVGR